MINYNFINQKTDWCLSLMIKNYYQSERHKLKLSQKKKKNSSTKKKKKKKRGS